MSERKCNPKENKPMLDPRIILWPNRILSKVAEEETAFDEKLKTITNTLKEVLTNVRSYGLAACQIGEKARVFIVALSPEDEPDQEQQKDFFSKELRVFVNPSIVTTGGRPVETEEYCLSFPGIGVKVKSRYPGVTIAAYDETGLPFQENFVGFNAVIIQHELAHLNGKTILDEAGTAKRTLIRSKMRKIAKMLKQ